MGSRQDIPRLSSEERHELYQAGLNGVFADHFGVEPKRLNILNARNIENRTLDGIFGFMEVTVEWTTPEGRWHWHALRFNGENPLDLSEDNLTLLGKFACGRETEVNDYTRDSNNLPLRRPEPVEAQMVELPLPDEYPILDMPRLADAAA